MASETALSAKYTAYPEYKESGFEWLGIIPDHWAVSPIKWQIERVDGGAWGGEPVGINDTIVLRSTEQTADGQWKMDDPAPRNLSAHETATTLLIKDDLLMTKSSGSSLHIGKTSIVTEEVASLRCGYSNFMQRIRIANGHSAKFYWYIFNNQLARKQLDYLSNSTTGLANLNATMIGEVIGATAPKIEQQKIANFLDHETAKIDTLIDKQQQLITLLKEKRQAVISHAVTKGLNPNAPMRDSGVEWLGEVPEHWDVCMIKHKCLEITDGAHVSPETEGGEHYFVSITDIKKGVIFFKNALLTTPVSYEYLLKTGCMPFSGDILFSKDGTIGQTAITPEGIDFVVASSLIIIRPNRAKVTPEYLDFLLQSGVVVEQVESFVKGAALRRLSIQNLLKIGGAFPPMNEQMEITKHLIDTLSQYDDLEVNANQLIALLVERRTALISAAVTGKIDVRNWQEPAFTNNNKEVGV
jgi:type I restriction enzyme S subunit